MFSRSSLPLATQFSATPPARQMFLAPVSFLTDRASRTTISSVTAWTDAARSMCFWFSSSSGLRGGPPNSCGELLVRHAQAGAIVEVALVEAEGAVFLEVDDVVQDRVLELRLAVGREAHHLVLARIDLEAGVVGEGRVEQAERVREVDLLQHLELVALAEAERRGRPLADAVHAEDRGLLEGRRERTPRRRGSDGARRTAGASASRSPAATSSSRRAAGVFWNSFSFSHSGMAMRNEVKPRGAKAR